MLVIVTNLGGGGLIVKGAKLYIRDSICFMMSWREDNLERQFEVY